MITSEFLRELQTKVNCQKYILDIVNQALGNETELNEDVKLLIKNNLNRDNIIEFYELLIYSGGLGEFYTPKCLADLVYSLIGDVKGKTIYEPTIGSGNLINKFYKDNAIYGQEFNEDTYEITKLLLPNAVLEQGDTLANDKFEDQRFDIIISNPPYGGNGWTPFDHEKFKPEPVAKSAIESAFTQHNLYHLNDSGKCIMILPHGCLFRGNKELKLRKYFIQQNWLECVIGTPSNLFSNTGIPVQIMIFNKAKTTKDILFIDASKDFTKVKKLNYLEEDHIKKIVDCYLNKTSIDKFSKMVTIEEIEDNDYNLNIPRYVDTFEEEEPIDIVALTETIRERRKNQKKLIKDLKKQVDELFPGEYNVFEELLNQHKSNQKVKVKELEQLNNQLELEFE